MSTATAPTKPMIVVRDIVYLTPPQWAAVWDRGVRVSAIKNRWPASLMWVQDVYVPVGGVSPEEIERIEVALAEAQR